MTRIAKGIPCAMPSSRAHNSGTSPSPSLRAAVAGNSAVMSSVAVKMMLTMSSCVIALRSSIASTSVCVLMSTSSLVFSATVVAPRRARSLTIRRLAGRGFRFDERGGVQRPHLLGRERSEFARRQLRISERADTGAHEPAHRMADLGAHAPDDALAALLQDDLERAATVERLHHLGARRARVAVFELDPLAQPAHRRGRGRAFDLRQVLLFDTM